VVALAHFDSENEGSVVFDLGAGAETRSTLCDAIPLRQSTRADYDGRALRATALGLKHAFVNQPAEVANVRPELAALVGMPGRRPDIVMRFGYGPALPMSPRRPVDVVSKDEPGVREGPPFWRAASLAAQIEWA
jgi:hypothetical protein